MKIAIFVHCFYPRHVYGTEAYTLLLAKNLQKIGHEVTVVSTTFQGEPKQERAVESYVWDGVKVVSIDRNVFPHHDLKSTFYEPEFREVQERILRGIAPDVVHITHLINHTASIIEVAKALRLPVVSTLTDFFGFCYNNKLETANGGLCAGPNATRSNCLACYLKDVSASSWAAKSYHRYRKPYRRDLAARTIALRYRVSPTSVPRDFGAIVERPALLRHFYGDIVAAIAPSSFLLRAYQANMPALPMRLSHFGIDIDRSPKPAREPGEPLVYGFIGQLARHKGVHLLIEAFAQLPSGSRLLIYGNTQQDAQYFAELKTLATGLNVSFEGTFLPAEMTRILGTLDVMIIPSTWYENSPLILLQSLATHTPCIVSDVEGMTEFVRDGVNGFHFRRGSATDLFEKMRRFVEDPNLAGTMSATTDYARTAFDMALDASETYERVTGAPADNQEPALV